MVTNRSTEPERLLLKKHPRWALLILLTVVVGCVLSLVGTWVAIAARRLPAFA